MDFGSHMEVWVLIISCASHLQLKEAIPCPQAVILTLKGSSFPVLTPCLGPLHQHPLCLGNFIILGMCALGAAWFWLKAGVTLVDS